MLRCCRAGIVASPFCELELAKRGVECQVCAHEQRARIEIGLTHGSPYRVLAKRFNVSADAIGRHARNHLSPQIKAAILTAQAPSAVDLEQLQANESAGLLSQLVHQRARLQQHSELASELGDVRAAVAAEGAITANLTLVGKLLGQLVQRHDVRHTSILVSPDYLRLRETLVRALAPYPEAARAVSAALHRMEADAARDITAKVEAAPIIDAKPLPPSQC